MNAEEKRELFLSFIHFCQDVSFGGVKDIVVFEHTPLFCNDWYKKHRRNANYKKPTCFTWETMPEAWLEFKEFLDLSFPMGIIREIKLQNELPVNWDQPQPSRMVPFLPGRVFRAYILRDASCLKDVIDHGADSQIERSHSAPHPLQEKP